MKAGDIIGGKYRINQRIGEGAMGAVWEAINERTGRHVALKLILHPTDDLRRRMLREARAYGSLVHRNIVEIYDVGETETGDPFLVMQLLSGETLADLLKRKRRIEPALTARIGRDIANAVAAAHAAQIIHRDLKPANIFLHRERDSAGDDFVLKVVDFGVSKNLACSDGPATRTDMLVGSLAYMSPEQVGRTKHLDPRTDIWSLGVLLFEMLVGVRPFQGSVEEVISQILTAAIPPVSSRVRQVTPELDTIVAKCLERNRDERWQTAADVARMLDPFVLASTAAHVEGNAAAAAVFTRPAKDSQPMTLSESDIVALDGLDLATTLPVPKPEVPADPARSVRTTPLGEGERGAGAIAAGTQLLPAADLIADPTPAWRVEMQRVLAANRQQSSPELGAAEPDDRLQGGTVVLSRWAVSPAPAAAEPHDPTTSSTAAMVRQAASPRQLDREPNAAAGGAFVRRGNGPLRAVLGVAVAVPALLALWLGIKLASPTTVDTEATSPISVDVAPAQSAQTAPRPAAVPEPPGQPAPAPMEAPAAASQVPPRGSARAFVPSRPEPPAPKPNPSPPSGRKPPPPCNPTSNPSCGSRPFTQNKPFLDDLNPFSPKPGKKSTVPGVVK